jgi:hypothetical protein
MIHLVLRGLAAFAGAGLRVAAAALAAVSCAGALVAPSPTLAAARKPVVLHLAWRFAGGVSSLLSDGRYVFVQRAQTSGGGTLIDDQTGRRRIVTAPFGCFPTAIGGAWLMFQCGIGYPPAMMLYHLASPGRWQAPAPSPELAGYCTVYSPYTFGYTCAAIAVGTLWLEYDVASCQNGEHCLNTYVLANIATGTVLNDPATAGGTLIADLNAPSGRQTLCAPLRVPGNLTEIHLEPGSLTFYGTFAVAVAGNAGDSSVFLERCGSRLRALLQNGYGLTPAAGNQNALLWSQGITKLAGVLLPNQRRIAIPLPVPDAGTVPIALGPRTLYISDSGLWQTTAPGLRPRPKRK